MLNEDLPQFKNQPAKVVLRVEQLSSDHYYWPIIDVDPGKEIIRNPAWFPSKTDLT